MCYIKTLNKDMMIEIACFYYILFFILGLELATPVLEQTSPFAQTKPSPHLLNMSMSWLLAGALPPVYSRPQRAHSPNNSGVGKNFYYFFKPIKFTSQEIHSDKKF